MSGPCGRKRPRTARSKRPEQKKREMRTSLEHALERTLFISSHHKSHARELCTSRLGVPARQE